MRLGKNVEADAGKAIIIKASRKISWPDLMFGPVNLWTLPSADFFYRKLKIATMSNIEYSTLCKTQSTNIVAIPIFRNVSISLLA